MQTSVVCVMRDHLTLSAAGARVVRGFRETHTSVLMSETVVSVYRQILAGAEPAVTLQAGSR